tara:strand:+ start:272 stop:493 length:222 start_codon:yes stop_codon:yes gene_type:complete
MNTKTKITKTKITFTVLMDKRDGACEDKQFKNRETAIRFAEEELKWENTLFVSVLEETEDSEKVIFNEEGSFA